MTAKEYLLKIKVYKEAIASSKIKLEELYNEAAGLKAIVYDRERVQVSPSNRLEDTMIRIENEAGRMAEMILKYQIEVRTRIEQITAMPNPDHAEILRRRYIDFEEYGELQKFEQIAIMMNRSFSRVTHLHGEALEAFRKAYLKDSKQ